MPTDQRVVRVATRLGFELDPDQHSGQTTAGRSLRRALAREAPPGLEGYRRVFLHLSHHAAATCTTLDPHCAICPLRSVCRYEPKQRRD
jgi:endonuclease III